MTQTVGALAAAIDGSVIRPSDDLDAAPQEHGLARSATPASAASPSAAGSDG